MARSLNIQWQEKPIELLRLFADEEDPEVAPRLHALWLLRLGKSLEEVAEDDEVHPRPIQQWVAWYRKGGLAEVRRHRRAGPGRTSYLNPEQLEILRHKLSQGTLESAEEMVDWVYEISGVTYTRQGIKSLRRRMADRSKEPVKG